jgi:hypothetical protein
MPFSLDPLTTRRLQKVNIIYNSPLNSYFSASCKERLFSLEIVAEIVPITSLHGNEVLQLAGEYYIKGREA